MKSMLLLLLAISLCLPVCAGSRKPNCGSNSHTDCQIVFEPGPLPPPPVRPGSSTVVADARLISELVQQPQRPWCQARNGPMAVHGQHGRHIA